MPKHYSQWDGYADEIGIEPMCGVESYEAWESTCPGYVPKSGILRTVRVFETALLDEAPENFGLIILFLLPFGESLGRFEMQNQQLLGRKSDISDPY